MEVDYAPDEAELAERDGEGGPGGGAPAAAYDASTTLAFAPAERNLASDVLAPLVPPVAIGVIAFAIVGLIIWAGSRMTTAAATRNGYTQQIGRAMAYQPDDPVGGLHPVVTTGGSVYRPVGAPRTAYAVSLPPIDRALVTGPFLGDENRKAAKASLRPLHDLIGLIRRYDANGLWTANTNVDSLPKADANGVTPTSVDLPPGGVAPVTLPNAIRPTAPPIVNPAANPDYAATRGATFQSSGSAPPAGVAATEQIGQTIEHIHNRADALATTVDMTTPLDQYPAPLRADVKAVSQELHAYLKDASIAATEDAANHAALRRRASQRLTNADQMLNYMSNVIDGTADANKPPLFPTQTQ